MASTTVRRTSCTIAVALMASVASVACHSGDTGAEGDPASTDAQTSSSTEHAMTTATGTTTSAGSTTEEDSSGIATGGTTDDSGTSLGLAEPGCPPSVLNGSLEIHSTQDLLDLPLYTHVKGDVFVVGVQGLDNLHALKCLHKIDGQLAIFSNPDL